MATMNVSLPEALKAWAEEQVAGGRYANVSDYIRDLIRRDQDRAEKIASLRALIDEAEASGDYAPWSADEVRRAAKATSGGVTP
ncbi:MAG: type II toxin-antitoxin system ParD family antitoxin [Hyphomonadaceae bacterium]|nr:type II toxin-antitoxin system ParD family antitoxin [Hyphomonadaceae bacterium]